jgi:protein gp37
MMGKNSRIEWTDATWNPVMGCTPVSEACENCYALSMIERFAGRKGYPQSADTVQLFPDRLDWPRRWTEPRRIFVCSMSDMFHPAVPFTLVREIWRVMASERRHTFMILTKRPELMLAFTQWMAGSDDISIAEWPRNVWLGVTAENQARADERIPILLRIPAAVRFVSIEPMLGPVDLRDVRLNKETYVNALTGRQRYAGAISGSSSSTGVHLDWVIVGGETGAGSRPMRPDWARLVRNQCRSDRVPFFFKQWGDWLEVGMLLPEHAERYARDQVAWADGTRMFRVGKKVAGRELNGRTWDERPAPL